VSQDAEILAFVEKVALNPYVAISHAYVSANNMFEGDLSDFVNDCVKIAVRPEALATYSLDWELLLT
jgi:hypothetical protein